MIKHTCPSCGNELDIPDEYAGKKGKCAKCQEIIVVPGGDIEEGFVPITTPVPESQPNVNIPDFNLKLTGWILTIIAACIIIYNMIAYQAALERARANPFRALFSRSPNVYSFTPPFSGFELLIIAVGIAGVIMLIVNHIREENKKA